MASKLILLCAAIAFANGDVSHLPGYAYTPSGAASTNYVTSSYSAPVVGASTTRSYTTGTTGYGAGLSGVGLSGFGSGYSSGVGLGGVGKTVTTHTTTHGGHGSGLGLSGFGARSGFVSGSSHGSGYTAGSVGDASHSTYTVSGRSGFGNAGLVSSGSYHTGYNHGPSLHFDAANVGTHYTGGASGGVTEQHHGQQHEPIVTKNFYFFSGPEDHSEAGQIHHVNIGRPQKNLKVIFIKNPSSSSNRALIKAHHAPSEEKTVVYVLSKHDNDLHIDTEIDEAAPVAPVKPDVVFVKYRNNEEIAHLQEEVKSKLEHIAGHVQVSDEGAAPVRSITTETHGAGAVIGSGSTTYTTATNLGGLSARSGFGDSSATYTVSGAAPTYTVGDASTTVTKTATTGGSVYDSAPLLHGLVSSSDLSGNSGAHYGGAASTTVTKTTTTGGSVYDSAPLLHGLVSSAGLSGSASEGSTVTIAPVSHSKTTTTYTSGTHEVPLRYRKK